VKRVATLGAHFGIVNGGVYLVKPEIMKRPTDYRVFAAVAAALLIATPAFARPIGFSELSLLIRMHEPESSIKSEVAERKLLHPLTQPQESILKSQGASDSLLKSLRDSNLVASKEEVAAVEAAARQANAPTPEIQNRSPRVEVFDVALGHPINLSQWGGLDYEFAFYSYRFAGEDHIQPAMIDQWASRTVVSRIIPTGSTSEGELFGDDWYPTNGVRNWRYTPYDGRGGTLYNGRGDFGDPRVNYGDGVAAQTYTVSRPIAVDWNNPRFFDGQPYTFYPVYEGAAASLYYITSSGDSARIAVVTR
jgi:hypothetical protein